MDQFVLDIDLGRGDRPLFLRISEAIVAEIRRGRFRPGDRLPSSRRLSTSLGVHRNTVLAAHAELERQGWIETIAARGTFVASALPEQKGLGTRVAASEPGFAMPAAGSTAWRPQAKGSLLLLGGFPDVRHVPCVAIARAYRRALASRDVLEYGDPAGDPQLRQALAQRLTRTRGIAATSKTLVITRGSQMALDLAAKVLVRPGDSIAVESLGYKPAWRAFANAGARVRPVAVDRHGLCVDRLAALVAREPIAAVYVTPHHQYPTTVTLPAPRRIELLALAARHRFAIIEDDYDHEFHYDGRPVLPLAARDERNVVIHIGSLSKVLAPTFRIGWISGPAKLCAAAAAAREHLDRQGDQVLERALAELIEDGELGRHILRMRRLYLGRRDCLAALLEDAFADRLRFRVPSGGMAMWLRAPGVDTDAWAARAERVGVVLQPGRHFSFDGRPRQALRVGFARLDEDQLADAVDRLARVLA